MIGLGTLFLCCWSVSLWTPPAPADGLTHEIGVFNLKQGEKCLNFRLYYTDSSDWTYPNSLILRAVYRDDAGNLVDKSIYPVARVQFLRLKKRTLDHIELEFRTVCWVEAQPGDKPGDLIKRERETNTTFTETVSLVDGIPTVVRRAETPH